MAGQLRVTVTKDRLNRIMALGSRRAEQFIRTAAFDGERIAKQSMLDSPPGRRYSRGRTYHIASRPGHPPRPDTGNLRNGITTGSVAPLRWQIRVGAEYGLHLEFGTRRMAARPFMEPMARELQKSIPTLFNDFLRGI